MLDRLMAKFQLWRRSSASRTMLNIPLIVRAPLLLSVNDKMVLSPNFSNARFAISVVEAMLYPLTFFKDMLSKDEAFEMAPLPTRLIRTTVPVAISDPLNVTLVPLAVT